MFWFRYQQCCHPRYILEPNPCRQQGRTVRQYVVYDNVCKECTCTPNATLRTDSNQKARQRQWDNIFHTDRLQRKQWFQDDAEQNPPVKTDNEAEVLL